MSVVLEAKNLIKHFDRNMGLFAPVLPPIRAVDGVSFALGRGEVLGLVGESGCGKSTLGLMLLRLIEPSGGRLLFEGQDITHLRRAEMRPLRRRMQIIFQDPYSSLNPRLTIRNIVGEPLVVHKLANRSELTDRVVHLLRIVGLRPDLIDRYPHELSGGQRQRVGIARALIVEPKLVVADEAVSALDVSIQAQVLNLLADLREQFQLSLILISHNISVVQHMCDRIAVMYLGRIVEIADADSVVMRPLHPYTEALLSAIPLPDPVAQGMRKRIVLKGDVPSPAAPPSGCHFHTRCPYRREVCSISVPALRDAPVGRQVACHFAEELYPRHLNDAFGGKLPQVGVGQEKGLPGGVSP